MLEGTFLITERVNIKEERNYVELRKASKSDGNMKAEKLQNVK